MQMKNKYLLILVSLLLTGQLLNAQVKTTYKYDAMQRITRVDFQGGLYETYSYDKVGNRKSFIKVVPIPPPSSIQSVLKDDMFKIYPNPTFGIYSLKGKLITLSEAVFKIHDLTRREILSQSLSKSSQIKQELDISKYTAGSYLLVIQHEDKKRSWTIIKQ